MKFNSRFDNKPWKEISADDVKLFIAEIMQKHSSKGDETHTTSDHKKVVKIFFRWLYYGHRSNKVTYRKFKILDSPVTEDIVIGRVKNKLVREDLLTEAEQSRLLYACGGNLRNVLFWQ